MSHKRAVQAAVEPQAVVSDYSAAVTDYSPTKVKLMLGAPKPKTPGLHTDSSTRPLLKQDLRADIHLLTKKEFDRKIPDCVVLS